jgi:hypothetical protein
VEKVNLNRTKNKTKIIYKINKTIFQVHAQFATLSPALAFGHFPVSQPGHLSATATPASAESMCMPHPAQVCLPHDLHSTFLHIITIGFSIQKMKTTTS